MGGRLFCNRRASGRYVFSYLLAVSFESDAADATHYLLDLYINATSTQPSQPVEPSPISPAERPVPPGSQQSAANIAFSLPGFWNAQTLTELKIYLRTKRPGKTDISTWPDMREEVAEEEDIVEGIGRNEGTVRFLWDKQDVVA